MDISNPENQTITNSKNNNKVKKDKFKRSTVIYNFFDYILKNIYLINDYLDEELDVNKETE
jgi:hypothetical protein